MSYEQRLIELEIKAAYQDDLLQELNLIVAQQQEQIALLEKTCQFLYKRIDQIVVNHENETLDQPPPHY